MYRGELPGACFTNSLIRFQASKAVEPRFALYLFRQWMRTGAFTALGQITTNIAHLGVGRFAEMDFPLPPLPEQRRIVAKLDSLQSKSRRAKDALDAIPPLLERFRQSVLAAAFRGDLTAEWRAKNPDVEPASELLKRIRVERRRRWEEGELAKMRAKGKVPGDDRWKGKYVEPEPVDAEGLGELPEGWCWATLEQVAQLVTGGTPPGKEAGCYGGTTPFFKPTDLQAGIHLRAARQYVTAHGRGFLDVLPPDSVLITCIGATIGKTGLARVECTVNQQINAAVPLAVVDAEFLYWFAVSAAAQDWITSNASATTLPILNKSRLARMPVPVAPISEQRQIALQASFGDRAMASLRDALGSAQDELASLGRSILFKAFRGELVTEDE
jgi:type I restriction enzyme S subunit